jgi:hypothetical protein
VSPSGNPPCQAAWQYDAVFTGTVEEITVVMEALPARPRHENDIPVAVDSAMIDKDGSYVLRNLAAGDYYLGVSLSRTPTLKQPYTRWFYPGTEDPAGVCVHVSDNPEVHRLDLALPDLRGSVSSRA